MIDVNFAPVCGLYCGHCEFLGNECNGCGLVDGRPFWTGLMQMDVCPIHDCCRNRKQMEHCGLCEDFPCATFLELRDPGMSDEEFQRSLKARQTALARRREVGTDQWLQEVGTEHG